MIAIISPLYAQEAPPAPPRATIRRAGGNMIGGSDMMRMMNMMTQMMATCNRMVQSALDKDHGAPPAVPGKKG